MRAAICFAVTILLSLWCDDASAQRNLPGQKAIEVNGAFVDGLTVHTADGLYRFGGSIGFTRTNRNHTHWLFAVGYQQKDYLYREQVIPKAQFTGEAGLFIPVLRDRGQNISFNAGVSLLAGYESSNWGTKLLDDGARLRNKDVFIWGGALTAQLECYLSNRVIILLNVKERGLFGTDFGNFHTQLGIGFRFVIN